MTRGLPPLFSYSAADTPIHRAPALAKLVALAVAGACAFHPNSAVLAGTGCALALCALCARIPAQSHLRNARYLFWYMVVILVFRFLGPIPTPQALKAGLADSGLYAFRLAIALLAGTVFYETTGTVEILGALRSIADMARRIARVFTRKSSAGASRSTVDLALLLSLTISFIPRIFESWSRLNRSWDARGGSTKGGLVATISRVTTLIPLLIISLLAVASDTERAIRNRSA